MPWSLDRRLGNSLPDVREQEQALAVDDLDAWVIADERFHDAIIEIARNRRIQKVIEPLNMQLHRLSVLSSKSNHGLSLALPSPGL